MLKAAVPECSSYVISDGEGTLDLARGGCKSCTKIAPHMWSVHPHSIGMYEGHHVMGHFDVGRSMAIVRSE